MKPQLCPHCGRQLIIKIVCGSCYGIVPGISSFFLACIAGGFMALGMAIGLLLMIK